MPIPGAVVDGNYDVVPGNAFDDIAGRFTLPQSGSSTVGSNGVPYEPTLTQRSKTNKAVAAGAGTVAVVVKDSPGELINILVTALGTAAMTFYDNASAASETVIGYIPASATAGTIYTLSMGAMNGIVAGQVLNSPAVTVSYL